MEKIIIGLTEEEFKYTAKKEKINEVFKEVLSNKKEIYLKGHTGLVQALIKFNDFQLISGSNDKSIKIFNILDGLCIGTLIGHEKGINALQKLMITKL